MAERPSGQPAQLAITNLPRSADSQQTSAAIEPDERARLVQRVLEGLISAGDACELLDIGQCWLGRLIRRGEVHPIETPLGRLFDRDEVLRLAETRRVAQAGRPRRGRPCKSHPQQPQEVTATATALPV